MTRAAERLVVCGAQGDRKIPDGCWYQLVRDALEDDCVAEPADDGNGEVLRYRKLEAPETPAIEANAAASAAPAIELPAWLTQTAPLERPAMRTVTPSSAGDEDDKRPPAGAGVSAALLRGSLTHRLLQALPEIPAERRLAAAQDYLARAGDKLTAEERNAIAEQVLRVLDDPAFREAFQPGSRAEVPIVGTLSLAGETVRVSGQIDRLAVTETDVLICDFKTNRLRRHDESKTFRRPISRSSRSTAPCSPSCTRAGPSAPPCFGPKSLISWSFPGRRWTRPWCASPARESALTLRGPVHTFGTSQFPGAQTPPRHS